MFYLSLLFTSAAQLLSNPLPVNRVEEHAVLCVPESANSAGSAMEDYLLSAGIDSLEHWLDLNA